MEVGLLRLAAWAGTASGLAFGGRFREEPMGAASADVIDRTRSLISAAVLDVAAPLGTCDLLPTVVNSSYALTKRSYERRRADQGDSGGHTRSCGVGDHDNRLITPLAAAPCARQRKRWGKGKWEAGGWRKRREVI